jgi:hypothetical protein
LVRLFHSLILHSLLSYTTIDCQKYKKDRA